MQIIPASIFSDIPNPDSRTSSSDSGFEEMLSSYMDADGQAYAGDNSESYLDYPYNPTPTTFSLFHPQPVRYTVEELTELRDGLMDEGVSAMAINAITDMLGVPDGPSTDQLLSEIYASMEHKAGTLSESDAGYLLTLCQKIAGGEGDALFNTLQKSSPEAGFEALLKAMQDSKGFVMSGKEMSSLLKHLNMSEYASEGAINKYKELMTQSENGLISVAEFGEMFSDVGTELALKKDEMNVLNAALEVKLKPITQEATKREEMERMNSMRESRDVANARILIEDVASQAALGRSNTADQDKQTRTVAQNPEETTEQTATKNIKLATNQNTGKGIQPAVQDMGQDIDKDIEEVQQIITQDVKQVADQKGKQAVDPNTKQAVNLDAKQAVDPNMKQAVNPDAKHVIAYDAKQIAEQRVMQAVDPNMKQAVDPNMKQAVDPDAKQAVDPNTKQAVDPNAKQIAEQSAMQATEREAKTTTDQNMKQATGRDAKTTIDQNMKQITDQNVGKTIQLTSNNAELNVELNAEPLEEIDVLASSESINMDAKTLEKLMHEFNQSSDKKENNSSNTFSQNNTASFVASPSSSTQAFEKAVAANLKTELPTLPRETLNQIQKSVLTMTNNGIQRLEIALNPQELGNMVLMVTAKNGEIHVTIQADKIESAHLIQQHSQSILAELENNGIKIEKLEVQTQVAEDRNQENWDGLDKHNQNQEYEESVRYLERLRTMRTFSEQDGGSLAQDVQYNTHIPMNSANFAETGLHIVA